ncbi:cysteine desulfurase family protein [Bacillus sp. 165]|uniref:cysteine desulfurase family protein n=1 Tax=Bacillus sp. 165 TaxID=1529117 RepID=UPI001ADB7042|nr:cysteine desulfurase family protein [Bacillus sp. 165]MBO9131203.1 cysteine desulfurase [Bacillus sp. 165]
MIYFDNSATTKPYPDVLQTFVTASQKYFGNPSSIHGLGSEAERLLVSSRSVIASMLRVSPSEIIFTSGGTEGNNLAIKGTAIRHRSRGRHVITTVVEHASVSEAFKQLEMLGFDVTYLQVDKQGLISIEELKQALRDDTILVSVIHVNNETGAIQPIEEIGSVLKQHPKIIFHVDHVQGVGKVPLDFKQTYIDLCTMSGHKFHSVKGTGILYVRQGIELDAILSGGQQENYYRSGTENLPGIAAMTKALRLTLEKREQHLYKLERLKQELLSFFTNLPNVQVNTPIKSSAPHIVNVSFLGLKPEVVVHELEKHSVYVSTKSACSSKAKEVSKVLLEMGVGQKAAESAIRISLSFENTEEEVMRFKNAINEIIPKLYEVMR